MVANENPRLEERTPVLIVGGGGAGLTASMLLARQGTDHRAFQIGVREDDVG